MTGFRVAVCSRSFSKDPVLRAELLEKYQDVTFNDAGLQLAGDSLVDFLHGHQRAIIALETVDLATLERLPELEVISKYGVGLDMIDVAAMRRLGKRLGWTPGVNARSVAELTIAFAISMLRGIPAASREVRDGTWRQHIGRSLSGRTFGIIGCGHVGKEVVRLLAPFGCTILAHDIRDYADFYRDHDVSPVGLDEVLTRSEVLSVHVPLDSRTRGMLDAGRLEKMKDGAILINTARGGIVDELAVKSRLIAGRLAAAAFDVFASEPPSDLELLSLPNFLATPHIGGSAREAVLEMGRAAIRGLEHNAVPQ